MATNIVFNDGASATLDNGKSAPFDRFAGWVARPVVVGPSANPQSSPVRTVFRFRTDYVAHFTLPMIPSAGASAKLTIAARLVEHLLRGGTCTVNTGDAASSSYTMALAPGTTPSLELTDPALMEYALMLDLVNTSASLPVCRYIS